MLALKKVIKAIPTDVELVNYTNALLLINQYAYAISSQKIPSLVFPPQQYTDYIREYQKAQNNPSQWTQTFFSSMVSTPASIINYPNPFGTLENHIIRLIQNPNDKDAKSKLRKDIENIQGLFDSENKSIKKIFGFLNDFTT